MQQKPNQFILLGITNNMKSGIRNRPLKGLKKYLTTILHIVFGNMIFKKCMIFLFVILITTQVFALDCQYTQSVFDRIETKAIAYSKDSDNPIKAITYSFSGTEKAPIYFFNENDFNVDIEYDLGYYCGRNYSNHYSKTLVPGTNEVAFFCNYGRFLWLSNLAYRENEFVYLKNKEEKVYKEICKLW